MKKILIGLAVLLILFIASIYIFIPGTPRISSGDAVTCVKRNILTFLNNDSTWSRWWPGDSIRLPLNDTLHSYNGCNFRITEPFADGATIDITIDNKHYPSRVLILPLPISIDSFAITWEMSLPPSDNPFTRLSQYFKARTIKNAMDDVLKSLSDYVRQTKNSYGFTIQRTTFLDTVLLTSTLSSYGYPSTEMIYNKIDSLRIYINSQQATETDPPMLNTLPVDATHYVYMVAIPINKKIPPGPGMFISQMIPMEGRFLETQVTGGPVTLQKAHKAVKSYMEDRMLTPPAVPFEILVTDRRNEPDTAKWMTKIYYPTMFDM